MDATLALNRPSVSVVISTFNRPETLGVAISSALVQTVPPLEILVIGDACDDRTAETVARIEGPIRYVNLRHRHGEQAVPNSAASASARGEVVAYLNHDDVWLPHHLEVALDAMTTGAARWHIGAAAFSGPPDADAEDGPLTFTDRTVRERCVATAFFTANRYLEPVSSWIVERAVLEAVGYWRPARDLYRTPTQDLALRLWREFGEPTTSDEITVLKPAKQQRPRGPGRPPAYQGPPIGYAWLAGLIGAAEQDDGAAIRQIAEPTAGWRRVRTVPVTDDPLGASRWAVRVARLLVGRRAAGWYRRTGVDMLDVVFRLFRTPRGVRLGRLLRNRTGESELPVASKEAAIEEVRTALRV